MKIRCPNCGASMSLDALLAHDEAREALRLLSALGGELSRLTLRYLGLFRPAQTELSFSRLAKLLNELLPDMQAQRIIRGGVVHDAPPEAWLWAMQQVIAARDAGSLKLPLKSHGYLHEILTAWRGTALVVAETTASKNKSNATTSAIAALQGLKQ